jgi:tRNA modification GTPase
MLLSDTIAAIATPPGEGGIGIVRVSGSLAISIVSKIFKSPQHATPVDFPSHTLNYGHVIDPITGNVVDEVMLGIMHAPKSYTAEDVVEFNCHGGRAPLTTVLDLTLQTGARLAEPGEFTRRAFLNGRIDLAQAESIVDLIRSKTDLTRQIAMDGLTGRLSQEVNSLNDRLANLLAEVEASIDFPDEELDFLDLDAMRRAAQAIQGGLEQLIATASDGKIVRDGINIAILGKPNVGKSSLLNRLLKSTRAIVTEIPGTTRDTIEEALNLRGIPVNLTDTAGIRRTEDIVEQQGVERSKSYLDLASLILMVFDASEPLTDIDIELLQEASSRCAILVLNKIDLPFSTTSKDLQLHAPQKTVVQTSMLHGEGIEDLKSTVLQHVIGGDFVLGDSPIITNVRHDDALRRSQASLSHAIESLDAKMPPEFIAVDLRSSLDAIGEIVGKTTTEDLLDRIFSQFCIGK